MLVKLAGVHRQKGKNGSNPVSKTDSAIIFQAALPITNMIGDMLANMIPDT